MHHKALQLNKKIWHTCPATGIFADQTKLETVQGFVSISPAHAGAYIAGTGRITTPNSCNFLNISLSTLRSLSQ